MTLPSCAKLSGGVQTCAYLPAQAEKQHDPDASATITFRIRSAFGLQYALALDDFCCWFVNVGSTGRRDPETLRHPPGVDDSFCYGMYKHPNARFLEPAVAEVNRTSNIVVSPEVRKLDRSVTAIRFAIPGSGQFAMPDIDDGTGVRNPTGNRAAVPRDGDLGGGTRKHCAIRPASGADQGGCVRIPARDGAGAIRRYRGPGHAMRAQTDAWRPRG